MAEDELEVEVGQISEQTESSSPRTKESSFSSLLWKEEPLRDTSAKGEGSSPVGTCLSAKKEELLQVYFCKKRNSEGEKIKYQDCAVYEELDSYINDKFDSLCETFTLQSKQKQNKKLK